MLLIISYDIIITDSKIGDLGILFKLKALLTITGLSYNPYKVALLSKVINYTKTHQTTKAFLKAPIKYESDSRLSTNKHYLYVCLQLTFSSQPKQTCCAKEKSFHILEISSTYPKYRSSVLKSSKVHVFVKMARVNLAFALILGLSVTAINCVEFEYDH